MQNLAEALSQLLAKSDFGGTHSVSASPHTLEKCTHLAGIVYVVCIESHCGADLAIVAVC